MAPDGTAQHDQQVGGFGAIERIDADLQQLQRCPSASSNGFRVPRSSKATCCRTTACFMPVGCSASRNLSGVARAPKMAWPTRTTVAPSSMATSKSPDMPIDAATGRGRAGRCVAAGRAVRAGARSRRTRSTSGVMAGSSGRTCARSKAGSCCTKASTASGSRPYLLGSAEVLTCTNTSSVRSSSCGAAAGPRLRAGCPAPGTRCARTARLCWSEMADHRPVHAQVGIVSACVVPPAPCSRPVRGSLRLPPCGCGRHRRSC